MKEKMNNMDCIRVLIDAEAILRRDEREDRDLAAGYYNTLCHISDYVGERMKEFRLQERRKRMGVE